jgi:uncharacterized membrane protein
MPFDIMPWIEMALRWLHVITGIAWIGSSFYFVWLDNHLVKRDGLPEGVAGDLWAVHGGGFYNSRKYLVAPPELPPGLHWFKYEAYFTWVSGFLLLGVLYYYGASIYLIDSTKAALTPWQAIGIGLGFLAGGWLVYDGLCRRWRRPMSSANSSAAAAPSSMSAPSSAPPWRPTSSSSSFPTRKRPWPR